MVGQEKLLNKINTYTIDTFPRSTIFVGEKGCGKHTLINYIKENILKLPLADISENICNEVIDNIYRSVNPSIYLIDLSKMTEKEQNIILKFVEEPLNNSFIILLCQDKNFVLNTILNRCISFEFEKYTEEQLKQFIDYDIDKNILLNVLKTPGNIKTIKVSNLTSLMDICNKLINKLNVASLGNTLTVSSKINFKDEYDKFDLDLFLNMLSYLMYNQFILSNDKNILDMYKTVKIQQKALLDPRVNKQIAFENLLIKLWKGVRYGY